MSTCTGYIAFINKPDEVRKNWNLKLKGDDTVFISRKPLDMYQPGDEIELEYKTNKKGFNWIDTITVIMNGKGSPDDQNSAWRDSMRDKLDTLRDSAGTII